MAATWKVSPPGRAGRRCSWSMTVLPTTMRFEQLGLVLRESRERLLVAWRDRPSRPCAVTAPFRSATTTSSVKNAQ